MRVPKLLEHYRFRLRQPESHTAAGQGSASPGDVLRVPQNHASGQDKGQGITEPGGVQFVLELAIDDIVDWLWEELELPNLQARVGGMTDEEHRREGWNRRGARSRLDRRRSMKEAVSDATRKASQRLLFRRRFALPAAGSPGHTNNPGRGVLRYGRVRKYERRRSSACQDILLLGRAGLRRQYQYLETVFVAHTVDAWEFQEQEFFQVSGTGGTVASSAFEKVLDSWTRATTQNGTTSTCSTPPTERTP